MPSSLRPNIAGVPNFSLSASSPTNSCVMNTAVITDITVPIISVSANPLTDVVPNRYRTNAATSVVVCASTTVDRAARYPISTATLTDLPLPISSLIRVKMITLESTAIPMDRMIPAIPGSVSTDPIPTMIQSTSWI